MKIYILLPLLFLSTFLFSSQGDVNSDEIFSNISLFDDNMNTDSNIESGLLSDEPEPEPDPDPFPVAPINNYLPLLAVAAVGIGFYYRNDLKQTIK